MQVCLLVMCIHKETLTGEVLSRENKDTYLLFLTTYDIFEMYVDTIFSMAQVIHVILPR